MRLAVGNRQGGAAVGDHHSERRQHIEIAAKALAADRVEDQIGAAASRKLAHAGDDARPPVQGLDFEVDVRSVSHELVI